MGIFSWLTGKNHAKLPSKEDLIRRESELGSQVFGPIEADRRREFFYLDNNTWVWYEEWTNLDGRRQAVTTRYEVRPDGIIKVQDGQNYQYVSAEEANTLLKAARKYYELSRDHIYTGPAQNPAL